MSKRLLNTFITGILVLSCIQIAVGCICENVPPPCYNYSQYETVFVGTVRSVKGGEENPNEKVEVEVQQDFKRMDHKTAFTYNYSTSCSWNFTKGDKFLFYGNLDEKKTDHFGTGYCTRTAPFNENSIDFDFLRKVSSTNPVYWVWGSIRLGYFTNDPVPGITAHVFDNKKKLVGVSDRIGNIKIPVSGEGKYRVRVFLPKGASLEPNYVGGSIEFMRYWESIVRKRYMRGAKPYIEFEVEVKPNKCGWFPLRIGKNEKAK